jgi:hypothetical protein
VSGNAETKALLAGFVAAVDAAGGDVQAILAAVKSGVGRMVDALERMEVQRDEARDWRNVKVSKDGETHCLGTLIELLERERDEAIAREDKAKAVLRRLVDAADAFRADQSGAHPSCGRVQPVSVAECLELAAALDAAEDVVGERTTKVYTDEVAGACCLCRHWGMVLRGGDPMAPNAIGVCLGERSPYRHRETDPSTWCAAFETRGSVAGDGKVEGGTRAEEVEECSACGGTGFDGHDCGEDTCCCADPEDNIPCQFCNGTGFVAVPKHSEGEGGGE